MDILRHELGADARASASSGRVSVGAVNRCGLGYRAGAITNAYFVRRHGERFTAGVFEGLERVAAALAAEVVCARLDPDDGPEGLSAALLDAHRVIHSAVAGAPALDSEVLARARALGLGTPRGMGSSCAVAIVSPDEVWLSGVGECGAWMLEDTGARELLVPETIGRTPPERLVQMFGRGDIDIDALRRQHARVVLKALGVDVEGLELRPPRRVAWSGALVLGSRTVQELLEAGAPRLPATSMPALELVDHVLDVTGGRHPAQHETCVVAVQRGVG